MSKWLTFLWLVFPTLTLALPLSVEQISPGIYVHHGKHEDISANYSGDICNISFVIGDKGVAVIDTGGSPKLGAAFRETIRGMTSLPILYVINTHVHPDHVMGNAAFKPDKPIFIGHQKLAVAMALRKDAYLRNQSVWVGADAAGSELIEPTLPISTTQEVDLGGKILRLTAHPVAHSPSDLTVFETTSKTLWTGDLLFIERTPSIDGDAAAWLNVIEQLRAISATQIVPGHGSVSQHPDAALDDEKRYLTTLLSDVRTAIKRGDSMEQTIPTAAQSEREKWLLFDIVNRRNVALIFPKLEWE